MADPGAPVTKHLATAREHLAGLKAAAAFRQELVDKYLLDTQSPIKDQPFPAENQGSTA